MQTWARFAAVSLAFALGTLAGAQSATIPIETHILPNGLRVVLSPDHSAPTVSLAMTYDVGSRNERPGRTGFAHLFEHMMFEGTAAVPKGEFPTLVSTHGGNMNGTTNKDRTVYYETLLSNQLDLGLFLESDRMRNLPAALTQAKLDNQRNAVQEERRLRVDNVPYGDTGEALDQLAYDNFHYQHSVIGSMADLNAATLDDVKAFFRSYYAPNNCVLSLVGDFDPKLALGRIEHYFGDIPRQPVPAAPDMAQGAQGGERRKTLQDPFARLPRIDIAYRIPPGNTPDWYALSTLGVILSNGRSGRLYQKLVQQEQLAVNAFAGPDQMRGPGLFQMSAMLRPGKAMPALEAALEGELADIAAHGVTAEEMERVHMAVESLQVRQMQSTLGRALIMGTDAVYFGDPGLINHTLDRYQAVTAADVQRVAKNFFSPDNRTVVITDPKPRTAAAGAPAKGAH